MDHIHPFTTPEFPGVDVDANLGPTISAITITFIVISFITICLRLFSRWHTKVEFWVDDYLILFAAVCNILRAQCSRTNLSRAFSFL